MVKLNQQQYAVPSKERPKIAIWTVVPKTQK